MVSPIEGKLLTLALLFAGWSLLFHRSGRLNLAAPYHVGAAQRDRRRSEFYVGSMWVGLAAAFASLLVLDALSTATFDSISQQNWVLGITRAVGVWGLMVAGIVWALVAKRAAAPNSDGRSLTPITEPKKR